ILAAVGPKMTEVAAETADGMIVHPFSNETYLRTVTLPAIEAALERVGRKREDFELSWAPFVVSGRDEAEFARNRSAACNRIAFYGSTPAYREVLECIGYGELQGVLNRLSKEGKWQEMGELIDDDILGHFAVVGEPKTIVPEILRRYAGLIDRTSAAFDFADAEVQTEMIAQLRAA
ncbi:MAG: LLM class flavin-dependent oxidoreductase, partial [Pseudomonadales bacterium]|nr:LLM class flavin-dependent oxidoreductase [Pseudomonadales bacterium]